jgi:hypothetical protein
MHDAGTACVGKKLAPVTEQPSRRDRVTKAHQAGTRILHVEQFRPSSTKPFDHRAQVRLRDVDHQLFIRLELLAVGTLAGNDARTRNLKLVPFPSHRFHEDGKA